MDNWGVKFLIDGEWVDLKDLIEKAEKVEAIKSWWSVFNHTIDSVSAKDRLAEVLGFDT